jgi:hypothetical protein
MQNQPEHVGAKNMISLESKSQQQRNTINSQSVDQQYKATAVGE